MITEDELNEAIQDGLILQYEGFKSAIVKGPENKLCVLLIHTATPDLCLGTFVAMDASMLRNTLQTLEEALEEIEGGTVH